jgi:arylsulfatase A-like enzyme
MRKPNLIVFLTDQQRADTVIGEKSGKVHAPNLRKLASESVNFQRAYVTHPLCVPSRASLLTGMWPHQTGCTKNGVSLDPRIRTFAELIGDDSYHPAYMGKWQLGDEAKRQRGFRDWISTEGVSDYSRFLSAKGYTPDKPNGSFSERLISQFPLDISKPRFLEEHACKFIEAHRRDPFVLFISFVEPHSPYNGPLNLEHALKDVELDATAIAPANDNVPMRYQLMREWQQAEAVLDRKRLPNLFFFGITPDEYRAIKQRYLGLVTMVDQSIGGILSCLERAELMEETIIVHTSDHGDMLGAHHLFGKEVMFEEAVRVPYLIRLPRQRRMLKVAQPVSHIDFLPTLLDLLGEPKPHQCAGNSVAPTLHGESLPPGNIFIEWSPNRFKVMKGTRLASRRTIKRAMNESTRAVISTTGWKLCLRDQDLNELYNLEADPIEARNLYHLPDYRAVIEQGKRDILSWQRTTGDTLKLYR